MIVMVIRGKRLLKYILLFIAAIVSIVAFFILASSDLVEAFGIF